MKNIIGLYKPMVGDIYIDGGSLATASAREKAQLQRKLGVMYQSGALFGSLNVLENVRFPLDQFTDLALADRNLTARMLLHQVEMGYAEALMPAELSGGMLKRAGIARAMALGCDILLLDEPSAGLAPAFVEAIFEKIAEVNRHGVTIVMVEQNARRALAMSTRGYVLDLGQNRFEGSGEELLHDPKVAELYLGGTARIDEAPQGRPGI
jgi:phospholipid/cholesterol/gamma-HCH transport system ATP-binding protein